MSAIPFDSDDQEWDDDDGDAVTLPGRPRRQWFNKRSAAIIALSIGLIGFYAGIRIEKGQISGSSTASAGLPAFAGTAGAPGATAGGPPSFAALGGGNSSVGTVSSVDGNRIYLKDSSGNTIKVSLSTATKLTKTQTVGTKAVRPGDSLVVRGLKNATGAVSATSVIDSGASSSSTTSTGNGNSAGSSGSSAVSSLFGSAAG